MKKNMFFSLIFSLLVNAAAFLINLFGAIFFNVVPFSIEISGGEFVRNTGFGISLDQYFPLYPMDLKIPEPEYAIKIDVISILVSLIGLFVITFIVKNIIDKKTKKKNKK